MLIWEDFSWNDASLVWMPTQQHSGHSYSNLTLKKILFLKQMRNGIISMNRVKYTPPFCLLELCGIFTKFPAPMKKRPMMLKEAMNI